MLRRSGLDKHLHTDANGWPTADPADERPDVAGARDADEWESIDDWGPTAFEHTWTAEDQARARRAEADPTLVPDKFLEHPW